MSKQQKPTRTFQCPLWAFCDYIDYDDITLDIKDWRSDKNDED